MRKLYNKENELGNGGAECLKEEKKLEENEKKTKLKENIYLEWGRDTDTGFK